MALATGVRTPTIRRSKTVSDHGSAGDDPPKDRDQCRLSGLSSCTTSHHSQRRSRGPTAATHGLAALPRSANRSKKGPPDAHTPQLGTRLEIVPGELTGVLGLELVVQRLRIVVVDDHESTPGYKVIIGGEDHVMALSVGENAHIQLLVPQIFGIVWLTGGRTVERRPSD